MSDAAFFCFFICICTNCRCKHITFVTFYDNHHPHTAHSHSPPPNQLDRHIADEWIRKLESVQPGAGGSEFNAQKVCLQLLLAGLRKNRLDGVFKHAPNNESFRDLLSAFEGSSDGASDGSSSDGSTDADADADTNADFTDALSAGTAASFMSAASAAAASSQNDPHYQRGRVLGVRLSGGADNPACRPKPKRKPPPRKPDWQGPITPPQTPPTPEKAPNPFAELEGTAK